MSDTENTESVETMAERFERIRNNALAATLRDDCTQLYAKVVEFNASMEAWKDAAAAYAIDLATATDRIAELEKENASLKRRLGPTKKRGRPAKTDVQAYAEAVAEKIKTKDDPFDIPEHLKKTNGESVDPAAADAGSK